MARLVSVLALAGVFVSPSLSHAAVEPQALGDNVIVIAQTKVGVPSKLPGDCQVRGVVRAVWQGRAFRPGQAVAITVPCASPIPVFDDRPATYKRSDYRNGRVVPREKPSAVAVNPLVLAASTVGCAHLDDHGRLIWTPTARRYGNWGHIDGYQVGGANLPLARDAA